MYNIVNNLPVITKAASEIVLQMDRMKYREIYHKIEVSATDPNVMLGGPMGFAILANEGKTKPSKDLFFYDIFTSDAEKFANNFIKKLREINTSYKCSIYLETVIPKKLYILWVDLRSIGRIINLDKYRGIEIKDLIVPVVKQSILFPEIQVHCVSGNVYMMEIYQKLYNPYPSADYKTYQELCEIEDIVYKYNSATLLATQFVGGGPEPEQEDIGPIKDYIIQILLEGGHLTKLSENTAIIGDYSARKYIPGLEIRDPRLQIVTDVEPEQITQLIRAILQKIVNKDNLPQPVLNNGGPLTLAKKPSIVSTSPGTPVDVQRFINDMATLAEKIGPNIVYYHLNIPGNFYIKKHTVYLTGPKIQQASLFDVFNTSSYEVLPFTPGPKDNRYIGPFAIIYFKLVDLWAIKLIKGLKLKSNPKDQSVNGLDNKMKEIAGHIDKIRNYIFEEAQINPLRIFQTDNFIGNYYVESVKKKKFIGRLMNPPIYLCDKKDLEENPIHTADFEQDYDSPESSKSSKK